MPSKAMRKPRPSVGIDKRKREQSPFKPVAGGRRIPRTIVSSEKGYYQGYDLGFKAGLAQGYEDALEAQYRKS